MVRGISCESTTRARPTKDTGPEETSVTRGNEPPTHDDFSVRMLYTELPRHAPILRPGSAFYSQAGGHCPSRADVDEISETENQWLGANDSFFRRWPGLGLR